jgi:hypothetical protein
MKGFASALIAAFCIQTAAIAGYCNYQVAAALLWIVAGLVIIHSIKAAGGGVQRRTRRRMRDALATIILVSGLLRLIVLQLPFGGGDKFGLPAPKASSQSPADAGAGSTSVDNSGDHTGIILLPEHEEHVTLVPPLPSMPRDVFDARHKNPMSIPFYGAYWFFKLPDTQPPPNSYRTHGTPSQMTFFAPDLRPLMMEAHQNLGKLINLACCREIRIEIQNADRYPGTVSVELVLMDTREGQEGSVSLGSAPVTSAPEDPDSPMRETLTFPVPARASISQFDELMIRFPRRRTRIFRSAKIAIERFVLIPRV